jgi:hypothetical protein
MNDSADKEMTQHEMVRAATGAEPVPPPAAAAAKKAIEKAPKRVTILRQPGPITMQEIASAANARDAAVSEAIGHGRDKLAAYESLVSQGAGD